VLITPISDAEDEFDQVGEAHLNLSERKLELDGFRESALTNRRDADLSLMV
jgi:hypothetical protein